MIYSKPNTAFSATTTGAASGLVGIIGVQILLASDQSVVLARTTDDITEAVVDSGVYVYDGTSPSVAAQYLILWDDGSGNYAEEDLVVTSDAFVPETPSGSDLCTVDDVLLLMEADDDSFNTDEIQASITDASLAIMNEYEIEFAPASTDLTRRFRVKRNRVKLTPYNVRTVTSAVLHPETSAPIPLDLEIGFQLRPVTNKWGVYNSLLISSFQPIVSQTLFRFGYALIDIQGDWGFASVPDPVKRAAAMTVMSWLRRDLSQYGNMAGMENMPDVLRPDVPGTYSIPSSARRLLAPYRRWAGIL